MKKIVILGSTGSIGRNAVDVARHLPADFAVVGLAARTNARLAFEQAVTLGVKTLAIENPDAARTIVADAAAAGVTLLSGPDAATEVAALPEADLVLVSLVGLSGLRPALAAIDAGHTVALATKEVLVAAGELVTARAAAKGVRILPVDSEHSAIFQCLQGSRLASDGSPITSLTLTASGGPFLDAPADLSVVTPPMALHHPRWKMGPKVTIDSATMMNKGFEILEARWLFDIPVDRIHVVVHPESVVHSLVTFTDGATLAQLSPPDMRVPIQYALTWPERRPAVRAPLDLAAIRALTFRAPDPHRFPALDLVRAAARAGGTVPAVLSAADEVAVRRFLDGSIRFVDIPRLVAAAVAAAPKAPCDSFDAVFAADAWARRYAATTTL